ncbi:MAG: B12-binding domain-containing radical SAM protein [Oligoflexia bacterium]|nr:B12-binding domain-containing radical SAM protein [Oligoflexia bacterium]
MKVVLIQIDLVMGARVLLSMLNQYGYKTKSLQINIRYTDSLSEDDLEKIYEYIGDAEVVGLSFNTFYAITAKLLADFLKSRGMKHIIAGGNHATALPEEVIDYADVVIRYEAEVTLLKVLDAIKKGSENLSSIKGILYKLNGEIFKNDSPPDIVWSLNDIPFQSVDTNLIKYFDLSNKVYTPNKNNLFPHVTGCYFLLGSRGCPFACTYCSNSLYRSIDKKFNKVRKRSIDNILEEMTYAINNGFNSFYVTDDNFFSFAVDEIEYFNQEYKKNIRKPFSVSGINPNNFRDTTSEKKLILLLDCGLTEVRIGVQSGSNKTLKIFKRGYNAEEVKKLLEPIERNRATIWGNPRNKLHVALDFICDAEWETKEDKIATIMLAQQLLKQYTVYFYTLVYLPGTEIYADAVKNNLVDDKEKSIYLKGIAGVEDNLYNRLFFLIAVTKERGVTLSEVLINHILNLIDSSSENAKDLINSMIMCINDIEKHHDVCLDHSIIHPYLTGFNEWTKTVGDVGKKVLFRSYHAPYG